MWGDATALTADRYAVAVTASQPIPADGGATDRVPPPPPGVATAPPPSRAVDPILPPPPLFTEPPPPAAARPFIVPTVDITVPPTSHPSTAWLLVIEGGRTFQLIQPRVLLGRDPATRPGAQEIVVNDPTRTVSKTHALLELVDDVWRVTDLGSVNGVILAEPDGSERVLAPGIPEPVSGRFALGKVWLHLHN